MSIGAKIMLALFRSFKTTEGKRQALIQACNFEIDEITKMEGWSK